MREMLLFLFAAVGLVCSVLMVSVIVATGWDLVKWFFQETWQAFKKWRAVRAEEVARQAQDGKCPHGWPIHNRLRDCKKCREEDAAEIVQEMQRRGDAVRDKRQHWRLTPFSTGLKSNTDLHSLLSLVEQERSWSHGIIPLEIWKGGPSLVEKYKQAYLASIPKPPASNIVSDADGDEVAFSHLQLMGFYEDEQVVKVGDKIRDKNGKPIGVVVAFSEQDARKAIPPGSFLMDSMVERQITSCGSSPRMRIDIRESWDCPADKETR